MSPKKTQKKEELRREEWDFSHIPPHQLSDCWRWEITREIPEFRTALEGWRRVRGKKVPPSGSAVLLVAKALKLLGKRASTFPESLFNTAPVFREPDWPDKPWQAATASQGKGPQSPVCKIAWIKGAPIEGPEGDWMRFAVFVRDADHTLDEFLKAMKAIWMEECDPYGERSLPAGSKFGKPDRVFPTNHRMKHDLFQLGVFRLRMSGLSWPEVADKLRPVEKLSAETCRARAEEIRDRFSLPSKTHF